MSKRNIVVIGGSAGAMQPLTQLLGALPADTRASLFAALHFSSLSSEWLSGHLRKSIKLPVRSPRGDVEVQQGQVIVARPDHHLVVLPGRALASRGPRENSWRPSIDVLFRTAAVAYSSRVIGVLLSGELDDGTAGLQAIKACGGLAIVQAPTDAVSPAMPRTATANVAVDHSASIEELPRLLLRLIDEDAPPPPDIPQYLRHEAAMALSSHETSRLMRARGAPSVLTCPECGGPLWKSEQGGAQLRCLVGHAYHLHSLLDGADGEIDRTLWAAIRLFEQRVNIARMLSEQERSEGRKQRAALYDTRAQESQQHANTLRELHRLRLSMADEAEENPRAARGA